MDAGKNISDFASSLANQALGTLPPSCLLAGSGSAKLVTGTRHLCSTPNHRFQCGRLRFRTLVVPRSGSMRISSSRSKGLPFRRHVAFRIDGNEIVAVLGVPRLQVDLDGLYVDAGSSQGDLVGEAACPGREIEFHAARYLSRLSSVSFQPSAWP